jgi:hypothetical protein
MFLTISRERVTPYSFGRHQRVAGKDNQDHSAWSDAGRADSGCLYGANRGAPPRLVDSPFSHVAPALTGPSGVTIL